MRAPLLVTSLLLVLLPVACHPKPDYGPSEATQRTDRLGKLRNEILELATPRGCKTAAGCKTASVGYNRCGGPRQYIVYCGQGADESTLNSKLEELRKLEEDDAQHEVEPPPCKKVPAPTVELADGVCRAKGG